MCEPVTLTTTQLLIAQAATAMAGLVGQQSAANAQSRANNQQAANARTAQVENANQVTLRRGQEADSAAQKINDNNLAAREAMASRVAAAGPTGLSVDALLGSMGGKQAGYNDSVNANLDRVNLALDNQLTNVNRSAASEVNSLKAPQTPDYFGAALRIGTAVSGIPKNPAAPRSGPTSSGALLAGY